MIKGKEYEKALKLCYEVTKDRYNDAGIPLFFNILQLIREAGNDELVYLYMILKYSNYSIHKLKEITGYNEEIDHAAFLLKLQEESNEGYLSRVQADERARSILYQEGRINRFYESSRRLSKEEPDTGILCDSIFRFWKYEKRPIQFSVCGCEIFDRKSDNVSFYGHDYKDIEYMKGTFQVSQECIKRIKSCFFEEVFEWKQEELKYAKKDRFGFNYWGIGFRLCEGMTERENEFRILNDFEDSDEKTNRIVKVRDKIFRILIDEGIDQMGIFLSTEGRQTELF